MALLSRVAALVSHQQAFLAATVLAALLLRLLLVVGLLGTVTSHTLDLNNFGWESWEMGWTARSILHGQGFSSPFLPLTGPTALVPPLYPYLLAGVFKLFAPNAVLVSFAMLSFNSLCSSLTCIPLYFLALGALNRRAARYTALAWAVYPFAIYFAADRVWDYALTSLLFTCCLVLAQRLPFRGARVWLGFGLLYGVTVLSNPSVTLLLPLFLLLAMYKVWRADGPWFTRGLIASLAFLAVCTPWTIRNHRVMHADFFIRDGFWLEFYAGNSGDTGSSNSPLVHPASNPAEMQRYQQMGEMPYMAEKHDLAIAYAKQHPLFVATATVRRFVRFWTGFWSFSSAYLRREPFDLPNVPFCLFLSVFMLRGLRRWWNENRQSVALILIAVVVFPIPYYLTHSSMDYRQPIEPVIVLLVAVGLFGLRARHPAFRAKARARVEEKAVLV